jgi:hypothetical protein
MTSLRPWTRDLHLYVGLFLSPFLLIFAVSTWVLNHPPATKPVPKLSSPETRTLTLADDAKVGSLAQARGILDQLQLTGEIDMVRHDTKAGRLVIPVSRPGQLTTVEVDLKSGTATLRRQAEGMAAALVYLHKRPGPHLIQFRGNWIFMAIWAWLADAVVYATLFVTATGLYLWWAFKAERTTGWVMLFAGLLTVGGLVGAMVSA